VFERLRQAPLARAALLAAGVLAIVASVGLHPESIVSERMSAHRGLASAHTDEGAHACPACMTHAAALISPAEGLPTAISIPSSLGRSAASPFVGRLAGRKLSGRSPPSDS
jgi:hypothetical protein